MSKAPITFDADVLAKLDETVALNGLGARGRSGAVNAILRLFLFGTDCPLSAPDWPDDEPEPAPRPSPVRRAAAPVASSAPRPAPPPVKARAILADAEAGAAHLGARAMESAGVTFGNIRGPMQKRVAPPAGTRPGGARR